MEAALNKSIVTLSTSDRNGTANPFTAQLAKLTEWNSDEVGKSVDALQVNFWGQALASNTTIKKIRVRKELLDALWEALRRNYTIRELSVSDNDLGEEGAMALAEALKANSIISTVHLENNKIGKKGAVALAEALKTNSAITTIDASANDIRDRGAVALAEVLTMNSSIVTINLANNAIHEKEDCPCYERFDYCSCGTIGRIRRMEGVVALAEALKVNNSITNINLSANAFGYNGVVKLAEALKVNSTIATINLSENAMGMEGAEALAEVIKVNNTIVNINLSNNCIGDLGAAALAGALKVNKTITTIILSANAIDKGAVELVEVLSANGSITYADLSNNAIGDQGAAALAEVLKRNGSATTIKLSNCDFGDVGLQCLCDAINSNTSITSLSVEGNVYRLNATAGVLQNLSPRLVCTKPELILQDSFLSVYKRWLESERGRKALDWFANVFWPQCTVAELHKFGAVAAVLTNNVPLALDRMRLHPDNLVQVALELQGLSFIPWRSSGAIAELLASPTPPAETTAARAVSAVVAAVQGKGSLSVVNVHICGEGYAGKTTTGRAIATSMTSSYLLFLQPLIQEIPLADGRTLGMVSTAVDYTGLGGNPVRALLHDYGGQEEFRANHAAHLAAPNSVYLIVLPLWDMRPRPPPDHKKPVDEPMDLDELVAKYTNWLKFINTIVEKKGARCITALNFSKQFLAKEPRSYKVEEAVSALEAVQKRFTANASSKVTYVGAPVVLDSNNPASVHAKLVPVLKTALEALESAPVPVAPALQSVLADMAVPNKWSLFAYESRLKAQICAVVTAKHWPSAKDFSEQSVRDDIVYTISHITQGLLESRRDIVVFKVHTGERVAINFPNWLTEKLLGSLFDPRRRARVNEAAAVTATHDAADPTHLLSTTTIGKAVMNNLDAHTRAIIDEQFIPKLLQHVGVCIPVVLGDDGLARGVAEGDDLSRVTHWFPAFSTTVMKETDGILMTDCDHVVARQFMLVNPEFCIFPPGYFSSLFVSIVGLHDQAHLVQLFQDGMELCSGSENFQIVVRRCADALSFVVTVATRGTPPGSSLAFDTMQSITQLIFGPGSWRRNVQVQECGLHPTKLLRSAAIPVEFLLPRLKDPALREVSLPFYFGMERQGGDRMVALQLEVVLAKLDAADRKAGERHAEVMSGLDSLSAQVEAQHDATERMEAALDKASAAAADSNEQVRAMCDYLLGALPSPRRGELDATEESAQRLATARVFLQERRAMLDRAAALGATQLQQMKSEIVEELGKLAHDMQRSTLVKLEEREAAQSAAAEERLRSLLAGHYQATGDALQEMQMQLTEQIGEVKAKVQTGAAGVGSAQAVHESILRLQQSITTVQTVQRNDVYGVYELPLLAEIKAPEPTGTAKDAALRCLYDVYRLHFLCPRCGIPAASGQKQKGYKLLVTKGWVAKMSKVLKVSLLALQVVSLVTPLPLPRVAELARYLPTEELKSAVEALEMGVKDVQKQGNAIAEGVQRVQGFTPAPPEITLEHVASIRELLLLAGESAPPKHTGLSPAICAATQQCAWVCNGACREEYMAHGDACLAIKMKLA